MIGNRQAASRIRAPVASSCQRCAPRRSVSGTMKNPAITGASPRSTSGAITSPAMNPRTTLGRLAIISITGLIRARHDGWRNWLEKIAARIATGVANSIA